MTGRTRRKDQNRFYRPGSTLEQGLLQIWEDVSVVVSEMGEGRELTVGWLFEGETGIRSYIRGGPLLRLGD